MPKMALGVVCVKAAGLSLLQANNALGETDIHLLNEKRWHEHVTEKPVIDTIEIWSIVNATEHAHRIHLHLVRDFGPARF
jgi:spore coat protein A